MIKISFKGLFKGPKDKKKFILFSLAAVMVILLLAKTTGNIQKALFKKPDAKKKAQAAVIGAEEEAIPVKAYKIKKTDFRDTLPCIGNVKGFKEIDLKFQVAGVVESFNFQEGEKIAEGDIIASLAQKDQLLKLKYAELELAKNQKLFDVGAISPIKLDQSKLEFESARSDLDKTHIYSVTAGMLGSRVMDVGSYVGQNDKVGIFVCLDKVYAEFNIIEKDVPKIALGQKAEVYADAYPGKSFNGVIDRISPIIEGRSRTELIKVELDNKEELLKPGMFVRAVIATYEKKEALIIPSSALKKKENDYFVYLVNKDEPKKEDEKAKDKEKPKPDKKAKKGLWLFGKKKEKKEEPKPASQEKPPEYGTVEVRKITVGYMTQDLVEIDQGLKEDDVIIIEVQEEFKDKARVEISEMQEGLA